jgi:hypothetical protein
MINIHTLKLSTFKGKAYFCSYGTVFEPEIKSINHYEEVFQDIADDHDFCFR